jgi:hypothetical protein
VLDSAIRKNLCNAFYNSGALRIHAYPTTPRTLLYTLRAYFLPTSTKPYH